MHRPRRRTESLPLPTALHRRQHLAQYKLPLPASWQQQQQWHLESFPSQLSVSILVLIVRRRPGIASLVTMLLLLFLQHLMPLMQRLPLPTDPPQRQHVMHLPLRSLRRRMAR
jgi:hypothetical protein